MAEAGLWNRTVRDTAAAISAGRVTAEELVGVLLERIARLDPDLGSVIALWPERALEAARAADGRRAAGDATPVLHGVPMAHKDMFGDPARPMTGGGRILARCDARQPPATVLRRLSEAGAITIGALNMSEFAAGPIGENPHFGDCRNPWDVGRVPGGSSSGSAAAVAARLVPAALGSDTGGSIRGPAGFCGVVGIKPTNGLVSRRGAMPRAWSLDCVGPIARSAEDCALLLSAIAGPDPDDPGTNAAPRLDADDCAPERIVGTRLAVPRGGPGRLVAHEGLAARLEQAIQRLAALGAVVVEVDLPDPEPLYALAEVIAKSEAAALHGPWLRERPDDYGAHVRARIEAGFHIPAWRYLEAKRLRARCLEQFAAAAFAEADLLAFPVHARPAPRFDEVAGASGGRVRNVVGELTRFTRPANYLGLPALSMPCGFVDHGLPVGMQLIGRPFDDLLLLSVAAAYGRATDWLERVPPIDTQAACGDRAQARTNQGGTP